MVEVGLEAKLHFGKEAPPAKLFPLMARLPAAETGFWRCRRQSAAVPQVF